MKEALARQNVITYLSGAQRLIRGLDWGMQMNKQTKAKNLWKDPETEFAPAEHKLQKENNF